MALGSAQNLNKVNIVKKMDVYVVVSISDRGGDANPRWEQQKLDEAALQANRLSLNFRLVCEHSSGDKAVGQLSIPVTELLCHPASAAGQDHSVTYDVRKPSGKPKGGLLTFSCKFAQKPPPAPAPVDHGMVKKTVVFGFQIGKTLVNAVASEVSKMLVPGPPGPGLEQKLPVGRGRAKPKAKVPKPPRTHPK